MTSPALTASALVLIAGTVATPVFAQTRNAQFAVRASVNADCQITAQDLNFGTYAVSAAGSGSTPLNLKCTPGSSATVSLDGGSSGNPQQRTMTGPGTLGYQLYRDAALQDPINTNGAAFQLAGQDNTGQTVIYTVYGQIPANQAAPQGNYTDTIRVTVTY